MHIQKAGCILRRCTYQWQMVRHKQTGPELKASMFGLKSFSMSVRDEKSSSLFFIIPQQFATSTIWVVLNMKNAIKQLIKFGIGVYKKPIRLTCSHVAGSKIAKKTKLPEIFMINWNENYIPKVLQIYVINGEYPILTCS